MWSCSKKQCREEVEAESINKPSGEFCWKDEKWKILKKIKREKDFCLFKDKEVLTHSSNICRMPTGCQPSDGCCG